MPVVEDHLRESGILSSIRLVTRTKLPKISPLEMASPDVLDHLQVFLAKREGIDKALKLIRYSSRLIVALTPQDAELHKRLDAFQSSVGVSRKAYRLGKFLQDINALRKSRSTGGVYLLEWLAYGGEGVYYFIEQLVWLIKAGAVSKEYEKRLSYISAWAELMGYLASIWISCRKMDAISEEIEVLERNKRDAVKAGGEVDPELVKRLSTQRSAQLLRGALILQDLADLVIALNDVRGGKDRVIGHPLTLALAGLLSASVSAYKNWNA